MIISASLIKELREQTGAGMMECKKALEEAQGDLEAAVVIMRKSGQAKAAKKGDRIAAEGAVVAKISADGKAAIILEVNCETDFAARDSGFLEFARMVADKGLDARVASLDQLLSLPMGDGQTVNELRDSLVAKIGENINIRRVQSIAVAADGCISSYVHGNGRIGVLTVLSVVNAELGKDIAMHIAACKPAAITPEELSVSFIDKEREIYLAQLQDSGKPAAMLEKIVEGKIQKLIGESVLIKQPFVKNPDVSIGNLLNQANASILSFVRFEVGEGIEKREVDFAAEVQAQVDAKK